MWPDSKFPHALIKHITSQRPLMRKKGNESLCLAASCCMYIVVALCAESTPVLPNAKSIEPRGPTLSSAANLIWNASQCWSGSPGATWAVLFGVLQWRGARKGCNRVCDRYEKGCAHSCALRRAQADAVTSYANGINRVTCDYKYKRIKSKYSKKAYTVLTARQDLLRLLSTIVA
jgi:hypothetical protein